MRIATNWIHQQSVNAMLNQQSSLAHTQLQVSTGRRILTPADDPVGAARAVDLSSFVNANEQYTRNIDFANSRLAPEESSLAAAGDLVARVRELSLQAANGTQSNDSRGAIAKELRQRLEQLVQLANSRDGNGEYIFAGNATRTQPFAQTAAGVIYQGDQGTRAIEISPGQTVASNDPGSRVFFDIPAGNGTFQTAAAGTNAGSVVAGNTSVTSVGAWVPDTYQITFTSPTTYDITGLVSGPVASGTYDPNGTTIAFNGIQIDLKGAAVGGDSFQVAPSSGRSAFTSIEDIARALETPVGNAQQSAAQMNIINRGIENLDQISARFIDTRAAVGGRMNVLEQQQSVNDSLGVQVKATLSGIEDLDYASAVAQLNMQMLGLQAAQQAYVKVQGLSLFNYIR